MQATLEPSIPAIEAAALLDRPAEYLAKLRRAAREFQFELTDPDKQLLTSLRRDRSLAPMQREDLISAVFKSSRNAQAADWRKYRLEAQHWVRIVRAYELERDWLAERDQRVRKPLFQKIACHVEKASRIVVASANKEEAKRRTREQRELRKHAKRQRRAFGYRGKSDGRTAWLTPLADGTYDPVEIGKAEFAALSAEQARGEANHGVYIFGSPEIVQKIPMKELSDEERDAERLVALLRGEVKKFKLLRKKNGTAD